MAAKNIVYMIWERPCKEAVACPQSWQWDTGQLLRIQGLPIESGTQVHFNVDGTSYTAIAGVIDGVAYAYIPDVVFQDAGSVPVYIYLSEDDSTAETLYSGIMTIKARPQPADYSTPTEAEATLFQAAIDAVRESAEGAEDAANLAESWAVGGTGTRAGEDYDNSKFYAELAKQQAAEGGFVYFEIQYPGYLIMTRSDNLDDDIDFALTDQGDLEVTLR